MTNAWLLMGHDHTKRWWLAFKSPHSYLPLQSMTMPILATLLKVYFDIPHDSDFELAWSTPSLKSWDSLLHGYSERGNDFASPHL